MTQDEHEMLIRHDEQLKAVPQLADAVQTLATQLNGLSTDLRVSVAKAATLAGLIGVAGAVVSCVGTWYVLIHYAK
jgi:hypothetical protein